MLKIIKRDKLHNDEDIPRLLLRFQIIYLDNGIYRLF